MFWQCHAMYSALSSGTAEVIAADYYAKREIMKLKECMYTCMRSDCACTVHVQVCELEGN